MEKAITDLRLQGLRNQPRSTWIQMMWLKVRRLKAKRMMTVKTAMAKTKLLPKKSYNINNALIMGLRINVSHINDVPVS